MTSTCTFLALSLIAAILLAGTHAYISSNWTVVEQLKDIDLSIPQQTHGQLNVYALPVGQGECTIIQCPNGNIVVIDCGSSGGNGLSAQQIENFLGEHINRVVAIVITQSSAESFNYLNTVPWYKDSINKVIISGNLEDYADGDVHSLLKDFHERGKLYTVNNGKECIGSCKLHRKTTCDVCGWTTDFCMSKKVSFDILTANADHGLSKEKSIIMKVTVGKWSMLLHGQLEGKAAQSIAKKLGITTQISGL